MNHLENIQARLSEIEHVFLPTICRETECNINKLNDILEQKSEIDKICSQIDKLDSLVNRVKSDLEKLETQMEIAEVELKIPIKNPTVKFLARMNPFINSKMSQGTNINADDVFQHNDIFKATDYFNHES